MSRPKHILMILENSGFPEDTRVSMEAFTLVEVGYRVSLIGPTGKRKDRYELVNGVHVYRYRAPWQISGFFGYLYEYSYSLICAFFISLWIFLKHGFDAIHIHCPPDLNGLLGFFYRMLGKKYVMDLHDLSPELYQAQREGKGNQLVSKALLFFERFACRQAHSLIATNRTQNRIQIQRGGADPARCYVVRNGPNEQFTEYVEPNAQIRIDGKTMVGYVGTMGVQDGVDYLLRVMAIIKESRDDIHAVLIGEGTALPALKELVNELELEDHVTFLGYVPFDHVPACIAAFDICATPDPSNPYNDSCTTIKTMEYMALGRPTVSFKTSENELSAGESALYANDINEFALLICGLADDPALRERMGQVGKDRIMSSLTWGHQRLVLLDVYTDLFGSEAERLLPAAAHSASVDLSHRNRPLLLTASEQRLPLSCKFPYGGALGQFLEQQLEADCHAAQLRRSFRWYYQVRSVLPIGVRNQIQKFRNQHLKIRQPWFIPAGLEDAIDRLDAPLKPIWPDGHDFALVLTHDVEEQHGFKSILKIADEEEKLGLRSSWNLVPHKYRIDWGIIQELRDRGHEIGIHGYNHDGKLFFSKKIFDSRVPKINQALEQFGTQGFRAPMVHRNLQWMQALEIEYDGSCFDVDPYQPMPGGVGSIWPFQVGRFIELPYTLPQDHTLFVTLQETTAQLWQKKFEFIRRYHGMALMLTHPDYLVVPHLLKVYCDFLREVCSYGNYWHVLPSEMASWYAEMFCEQFHTKGVQATGASF